MSMTLHVDIVSLESQIYSGLASFLAVTGVAGELGIYPGHTPLLTMLKPGQVRIAKPQGEDELFYIKGGVLEIQPHVVTILADEIVRATDLDEMAALEVKEKAEHILKDKQSAMDYAKAIAELAQATAQLQTIYKLKKKLKMDH